MMTAPVELTPHAFFEVLLPYLLQEKGVAAHKLDAVIQFYLLDDHRGCWFADLTDPGLPVQPGEHDTPDLTVHIESGCIDPLLLGELDVSAAVDDERLAVHGDRQLLAELAELFASGQSWLEARVARARSFEEST